MTERRNGGSKDHGYQPSKSDSGKQQGGYTPTSTGEKNPAPPPKKP